MKKNLSDKKNNRTPPPLSLPVQKEHSTLLWAFILFLILESFVLLNGIFLGLYVDGWHAAKILRLLLFNSYSMLTYTLPFLFLGRFKRYYFVFAVFIFFINAPLSFMLYKYTGGTIVPDVFAMIEDFLVPSIIMDFFVFFVGLKLGILLVLFGILFLISLFFLLRKFFKLRFDKKRIHYFAGIGAAAFLALALTLACFSPYKIYAQNFWNGAWFVEAFNFYRIYKAKPNYVTVFKDENAALFEGMLKDTSDSEIIGIVMVGESLSSELVQAYGYNRNTSPNLAKYMNGGELFIYNAKVKVARTLPSLWTALTFSEHKNPQKSAPISLLMKQCNVGAHYITAMYDSVLSLQKIFSHMDTRAGVPNDVEITSWHDDNLLPILSNTLKEYNAGKNCYFMHFQGSHFNFDTKYPKEFRIFDGTKDEYTKGIKSDADIYSYNSYDNTVAYFDYIFDKIIKNVKEYKKPAFVLYFSDHGEGYSPETVRYQPGQNKERVYKVPFIIWFSKEYEEKYPETARLAKLNAGKKMRLDISAVYAVLNLMQIHIPLEEGKTILGEHYAEPLDFENYDE